MCTDSSAFSFNEDCLEYWTYQDFIRSIDFPLQICILAEFGWNLDCCCNAWKEGCYISNSGKLHMDLPDFTPMFIEEWLMDEWSSIKYPDLYEELKYVLI